MAERWWRNLLVSILLLLAITVLVAVIFQPFPSIAQFLPFLSGPPELPVPPTPGEPTPVPTPGRGPPGEETPQAELPEGIRINVVEQRTNVPSGENGTISVLVQNPRTNYGKVDVEITVLDVPGARVIGSSTRSITLSPGEYERWSIPVDLGQGLHNMDVVVDYRFDDYVDGEADSVTESVTFSKGADEPTITQQVFVFLLVSSYVFASLSVINREVGSEDTSEWVFVGLGLAIASFVAPTKISLWIVMSSLGSGLVAVTFLGLLVVVYSHGVGNRAREAA